MRTTSYSYPTRRANLTFSGCSQNADVPFLQGRAFVFVSQFSELLPTQLAKQYLDAAISVLDSADASVPVKVSAVRALTK